MDPDRPVLELTEEELPDSVIAAYVARTTQYARAQDTRLLLEWRADYLDLTQRWNNEGYTHADPWHQIVQETATRSDQDARAVEALFWYH